VKGSVDADLRALIEVSLSPSPNRPKSIVVAWIDTAFNGGLVLPRQQIDHLGLQECSSTSAILADGQQVQLPTYTCYLDWFGKEYRTQVIANEGTYALLGTMLLDGHDFAVSYKRRTLSLD
jgi:clan AA aspartic protease